MPVFEPKKALKQISNTLLREYFTAHEELLDVHWDDLSEHKIEPIYEAWQSMPEKQRNEVQLVFQAVAELSDERGVNVLIEILNDANPGLVEQLDDLKSRQDIALWIHMHAKKSFDRAVLYAHADSLSIGRYWFRRTGLPTESVSFGRERIHSIEGELSAFYDKAQMRGRRCKVEQYSRAGGNQYLFAYLEDHPDGSLGFVEGKDEPVTRSGRAAFENVFVLNSEDGTLEMFVKGGKKVVDPLLGHICRGLWGRDIESTAFQRPSYSLDHLLAINHPLPTDPAWGVSEAKITRMRITPRGSVGYLEVKADRGGTPNDIYGRLEHYIQLDRFPQSGTKVLQVTFQLEFDNGHNKRSTMSFDVSVPDTCTLKSKPESHRSVGEQCLKKWGVICDS